MKTMKQSRWMAVAILSCFAAAPLAQAFYNPNTGRWLNRDPLGEEESRSLSAFANNDPMAHVDLLGLYNLPTTIEKDVSPDKFTTEDGHFEAISGGIKPGPVINCTTASVCDGQKLQSLVIDVVGRIQIKRGSTGNERMLTGRTLLEHERAHAANYAAYITGQETVYLYLTRACLKPLCFRAWVAYLGFVEPYEAAVLDFRNAGLDCADYRGSCDQREPLQAAVTQKHKELQRAYQLVQSACN